MALLRGASAKSTSVYPGKVAQIAPNLVRDLAPESEAEIIFSDIFEVQLSDRTKAHSCFARLQADATCAGMSL